MSSNARSSNLRSPSPALSPTPTFTDGSPPIRHRPTFSRLASVLDGEQQRYEAVKGEEDITEAVAAPRESEHDSSVLGISFGADTALSSRHFSGSTVATDAVDTSYDSGSLPGSAGATHGQPRPYWYSPGQGQQSVTSFQSSLRNSHTPSETHLLNYKRSFAETVKSSYDDFSPHNKCPARKRHHHGCSAWPTVIIIFLSVYSTVFSATYMIIAASGPRYGKHIGPNGKLTSANASLLTAFFAKTIELSFTTVFVAFIGQVLWRRAFSKTKHRGGITLAEMDMRSWVMQPGTILTHFGAVRSSMLSVLGILTLAAAVMAMLYTTASDALVQPQLKFSRWEKRVLQGVVKTSWANSLYIEDWCLSPTKDTDPVPGVGATTCTEIEYAAQAFHNYQRYLSDWDVRAMNGNASTTLAERPQGFALLTENTTVTGQWIEVTENGVTQLNGRVVNNISMAMPHVGVTSAARDSVNNILQPEDLDGLGVYSLAASLWSPVVNVLCANVQQNELEDLTKPGSTNFTTAVDDIFGWGPQYGQVPPTFAATPTIYNTVLNHTGKYGREAIYLLGKGVSSDYLLCSIKTYRTPSCSTRYTVKESGAQLWAVCEDDRDAMQYNRNVPGASMGNATISLDWVEGATDWANSLSLDAGLNSGNASNARLLTQLILDTDAVELNAALPSPAEALAVMAGCTLLMGTQDAELLDYWNYSSTILSPGRYEKFNATLRAQQFASGGSKGYQHGFYIVLVTVFILNLICLVYFVLHRSLITDFSEPVNLFSLAINSPPSDAMVGSCGGGAEGSQYRVPWYVDSAGDHLYLQDGADGSGVVERGGGGGGGGGGPAAEEEGYELKNRSSMFSEQLSPVKRAFERLSKGYENGKSWSSPGSI